MGGGVKPRGVEGGGKVEERRRGEERWAENDDREEREGELREESVDAIGMSMSGIKLA